MTYILYFYIYVYFYFFFSFSLLLSFSFGSLGQCPSGPLIGMSHYSPVT